MNIPISKSRISEKKAGHDTAKEKQENTNRTAFNELILKNNLKQAVEICLIIETPPDFWILKIAKQYDCYLEDKIA